MSSAGRPLVELNGVRIWAIGFEAGQSGPPRKLVCGTLARWGDESLEARAWVRPDRIALPGRPDVALAWTGWFELLTGETVAVYGATVEAVGTA